MLTWQRACERTAWNGAEQRAASTGDVSVNAGYVIMRRVAWLDDGDVIIDEGCVIIDEGDVIMRVMSS